MATIVKKAGSGGASPPSGPVIKATSATTSINEVEDENSLVGAETIITAEVDAAASELVGIGNRGFRADSDLLYADSGGLKSWNCIKIAEHVLETTGKLTRVVYADLGGYEDMKNAAEGGLIQLFNLGQTASPVAALQKLARGEWPVRGSDGVVDFKPFAENGGPEIGCYVFDSLTATADMLMQELVAKGQRTGQDVVARFSYFGETFGSPSQSHYGTVQSMMKRFITVASNLPVNRVIYTALEGKGQDEQTKATVLGPKVIGQAMTDAMGPMIGNTFHLQAVAVDGGTKIEYRCYFRPHPHPTLPLTYPAKVRLDEGLDEWNKLHPEGYFLVGKEQPGEPSVASFLEFREHLAKQKVQKLKDKVAAARARFSTKEK